MIIYHYADIEIWRKIINEPHHHHRQTGLKRKKRIKGSTTNAIFAFLEPVPENWKNNQHFQDILEHLKGDMGELLLEIDVNLENDNIFVIDRGHVEGFLYDVNRKNIPNKYLHDSRKEADRAYLASKIPLKEYLEKQNPKTR